MLIHNVNCKKMNADIFEMDEQKKCEHWYTIIEIYHVYHNKRSIKTPQWRPISEWRWRMKDEEYRLAFSGKLYLIYMYILIIFVCNTVIL